MKHFYTKIGILAALTIGTIITTNIETSTHTKPFIQVNKETSAKDLHIQSLPSVFAIYLESKTEGSGVSGTGFAIEYNNEIVVVTNEHVVPFKKQSYYLVSKDGKKYKAKLIYSDKEDDIAFLKFNQKTNIPPLNISTKISELSIGNPVFTIGNPYDFLFSYSDGIVSNINKDVVFEDGDFDELLIQTNIDVNPGNSGGPLLNENGEVIGIVSSMLEDSAGMSFAVPSELILEHLGNIK